MTQRTWTKNPRVAEVVHDSSVSLINLADRGADPVILEGVAAYIWQLLAAELAEEEAVERVATAWHMTKADVSESVEAFLSELGHYGLIRETRPPH
jgi:hypothetical protein